MFVSADSGDGRLMRENVGEIQMQKDGLRAGEFADAAALGAQGAIEQPLSASGRPLADNWLMVIVVIWAGQAISMITSYAAGYAAVWWLTENTGSALMLALGNICAFLPQGVLSPFGGVIGDKFNRKKVMIAADLSVGLVSLALAIVIVMGHMSVALILVMVVVRSVGQAFHGPAMMAAMPMLVPKRHLMRINTLDQALMSIAAIGSPAFGIILYTTVGFQSVMFLDFGGAIVAVAALMLAHIPTVHDSSMEGQHVMANLKDGWNALAATRGLVILLGGITLGMMAFGPVGALFLLMTYDHFAGNGYMAALVEGVYGAGMLIGSVALIMRGDVHQKALLICISALIVGATTLTCGLLAPDMFPAFVVVSGIMALACAWFNTPLVTLIQTNVPEEKSGRALGLGNAAIGIASPVGIAIGGRGRTADRRRAVLRGRRCRGCGARGRALSTQKRPCAGRLMQWKEGL
jgi:DHA3 family macrolide efflux protein-like MFS transporter